MLINACTSVVERDGPGRPNAARIPADATPKVEPLSKYGNPDSYVVLGKRYHTLKSSQGFTEQGIASWYGKKFHGRKTSSGEVYDMYQMTAAHKHLPLPSYVEVRNVENGQKAIVKVNDRGPFHDKRIIDLSYAAAQKLGVVDNGTAFVEIRALDPRRSVHRGSHPQPSPVPAAETAESSRSEIDRILVDEDFDIYLQIGAFSERANADALYRKVGGHFGDKTRISETNQDGGSIFRVQVGPIASVHTADQYIDTLFELGIAELHFIMQ